MNGKEIGKGSCSLNSARDNLEHVADIDIVGDESVHDTNNHTLIETVPLKSGMEEKEKDSNNICNSNSNSNNTTTCTALAIKNEKDIPIETKNESSTKSAAEATTIQEYNQAASDSTISTHIASTTIQTENLESNQSDSTVNQNIPSSASTAAVRPVKVEQQVDIKNERNSSQQNASTAPAPAPTMVVKSEGNISNSESINGNSIQKENENTQSQTQTIPPVKTEENIPSRNEIPNTSFQTIANNPTPTTAVKNEHNDDNEHDDEEEEIMDEEEWRNEFKEILDDIDRKGDFCTGKNITPHIPRFSPRITVHGMEENEQLTYPLMDYQAKRIRSFAEKAPFGKGLDTVLDESIRKAWQIDAAKVKFCDSDRWQMTLQRIILDCSASLGMTASQQAKVYANLYKLLLYEPGGHFKKHRDTEKEPGMFGTLIIQLPSNFTGGALTIEHAGEQKTLDFSTHSSEGFYATAFFADCEHELLPVQSGWRLCLAYNLVMQPSPMEPLPSAHTLTYQAQRLRKLANQWNGLFYHAHGYLLEHNYTETNLHFANLKGRDKEVVDLLRGSRDVNGNPLFVACLMLISKRDTGIPSYDRYGSSLRGYGESDEESDDHNMEEVHDTEVGTDFWIGPDDKRMNDFELDFDWEEHLLTNEDTDEIFGDDPSRQEYESYTGNAGPTLDYYYYRGAVVFWPRSMNIDIMKSAGLSYMLSYLKIAPQLDRLNICNHLVTQIECKKLQISSDIFIGIYNSNDDKLLSRALKSCDWIPDTRFAQNLAQICISKFSIIKNDVLELVTKTSNAVVETSRWNNSKDPVLLALDFLNVFHASVTDPFLLSVKQSIATGALNNEKAAKTVSSSYVDSIAKICFDVGGDTFQSFCDAVKLNSSKLSSVLKYLIALGDAAVQNPLVVDLANIRAKKLRSDTKDGLPVFSWSQPNANFSGSQSDLLNLFLRGPSQSQTFYHFNGIGHARNWASKYFGGYGSGPGYSAVAAAGGRGSGAYVTVTKTKKAYEKDSEAHNSKRQELRMLKRKFKHVMEIGNIGALTSTISSGQNQRRQDSDSGPPKKKVREIIVLD